jgi:cell division protein FtsZ
MKSTESLRISLSNQSPRIKVIGLGGAGCNTINRLSSLDFPGISLAAANTDSQSLGICRVKEKILLGVALTRGLGSGGNTHIGRQAAEESYRELIASIKDCDLLFLTAGMGGGTGSGAIEIAARIARSFGIMTIAVVTMPFTFESGLRTSNAYESIACLRSFVDTLITIPNDRLLMLTEKNTSLSMAFSQTDELLIRAIQGLSSIIRSENVMSVDMSHVLRLMKIQGGSFISTGTGKGEYRVIDALNHALSHPLLEEVSLASASGLIVKLVGRVSVHEIQQAVEFLKLKSSEDTEIITAVSENNLLEAENQVQAMILVTGVGALNLDAEIIENSESLIDSEKYENEPIPVSGKFPQIGFTPAEAVTDGLEIPAFLRNSQWRVMA